jgi:hypothetical protein
MSQLAPGQSKALTKHEAASRLGKLRGGKRLFKDLSWPGEDDLKFKLRVLSCSELQECQSAAWFRFMTPREQGGLGLDPTLTTNIQLFNDEVITQILFHACRDAENTAEHLAGSVDELRDETSIEERASMFGAYLEWQSEIDPAPEQLTPELAKEIVELLKKKDRTTLSALGSRTLLSYLLSLDSPPST